VFGVFANNANHATPVNHFALIAYLLDGRADFHKTPDSSHWLWAIGVSPKTGLGSMNSFVSARSYKLMADFIYL
jgi:hypothetical protein